MKLTRRIYFWGGLAVVIGLLNSCMLTGCGGKKLKVAEINGYSVYEDEFKLFLDEQKGNITSYYFTNYGIENYDDEFWNTAIDGQTPIEKAREQAMEACVEAIVIRQIAEEADVAYEETYDSLYDQWEEYNKERRENKEDGDVVYGPVELDIDEYYRQYLSKLEVEVQEKWKESEPFSDGEIQDYYDRHQQEYADGGSYIIEELYIESGSDPSAGEQMAQEAYESLNNGISFEQAASYYMQKDPNEYEFLPENRKSDEMEYSELIDHAKNLGPGEISEVFQRGSGWSIIRLISGEEGQVSPLEDVRNRVISALSNERFEQRLDEQKDKADVTINEDTMDSISY